MAGGKTDIRQAALSVYTPLDREYRARVSVWDHHRATISHSHDKFPFCNSYNVKLNPFRNPDDGYVWIGTRRQYILARQLKPIDLTCAYALCEFQVLSCDSYMICLVATQKCDAYITGGLAVMQT